MLREAIDKTKKCYTMKEQELHMKKQVKQGFVTILCFVPKYSYWHRLLSGNYRLKSWKNSRHWCRPRWIFIPYASFHPGVSVHGWSLLEAKSSKTSHSYRNKMMRPLHFSSNWTFPAFDYTYSIWTPEINHKTELLFE